MKGNIILNETYKLEDFMKDIETGLEIEFTFNCKEYTLGRSDVRCGFIDVREQNYALYNSYEELLESIRTEGFRIIDIGELSNLIKINNLDNYTIEEFSRFLREEDTIKKYSLNNYKNTEIQLVNFKLVKDLDDFRIIIYSLINLDDETYEEILSYSKEYLLGNLQKGSVDGEVLDEWIE